MKQTGCIADFEGKMTSTTSHTHNLAAHPPAALSQDWRKPAFAAAVLTAIFVLVFWDFLARQVHFAFEEQADFGHTLVVPFISGYFVYLNRHRLLAQPFRTNWFGLLAVIIGVAWYVFSSIGPRPIQHHNVQAPGVAMTIGGLVLLLLGWRATLLLLFPMLYLFVFGQYISPRFLNIVTYELQDITARGSALVMEMFLEVERNGNTITIFHNGEAKPLNIAEACSGMRMLMAFLALGVFMAYTGLKRFWQQAALVIMAVPTAIFVNVLRVITLGVLSLYDTGLAAGDFHEFIGLLWLIPAFFLFLGFMWIIRQLVVDTPNAAPKPVTVVASTARKVENR